MNFTQQRVITEILTIANTHWYQLKLLRINVQTKNTSYTEFTRGSVCKVYVKFSDEQPCSKALRLSYLGWQNF